MNAERRKMIKRAIADLQTITDAFDRLIEMVSVIHAEIEGIRDEEQDYFDNMPEALQSSERGAQAETAVSELEEALGILDEFMQSSFGADEVVGHLEEAAQ